MLEKRESCGSVVPRIMETYWGRGKQRRLLLRTLTLSHGPISRVPGVGLVTRVRLSLVDVARERRD